MLVELVSPVAYQPESRAAGHHCNPLVTPLYNSLLLNRCQAGKEWLVATENWTLASSVSTSGSSMA